MMGNGKYYNGLRFESGVQRIPKLAQNQLANACAYFRTGKRQFLDALFGQ